MQNFHRNSESTADTSRQSYTEPRICSNDDCSFPFGPACAECSLAFDLHQMRRTKLRSPDRTLEWIHGESAETKEVMDSSQIFVVGSDGEEDTTEGQGWTPQLSNASSARFGGVSTCSTEDENDQTSLLSTRTSSNSTAILTPTPQEPSNIGDADDSSSCHCSLASSTDHQLPVSLDDWLSDLFANTLEAQLKGTHFIGGAEDENSTLKFCSICYGPLGDPSDQHLLKCQYAHEEQKRMEEFIARAEKRTRS
jgi:hypothetical protein